MVSELPPESLNRPGIPATYTRDSADNQPQPTVIIGQPRATAALEFGLNMRDRGYHVFVAGPAGTGKMTAVNTFLGESARARPTPDDWCYVYNFADPEHPRALRLPAGRVRGLARDLDRLQEAAIRQIPRAFESDQYTNQRDAMLKGLDKERESQLSQLNEYALKQGFALQAASMGLMIVPLRKGKPMSEGDFNALTPEQREELQNRRTDLDGRIEGVMKALRERERTVREEMERLDHDVALFAVGGLLEDVSEHYRDLQSVVEYLNALREDLAAHVSLFRPAPEIPPMMDTPMQRQQALRRYRVNVIVDHGEGDGAPVVVETNPTYQNLIGRIEKESQYGVLTTDFTLIRGGALHRANGGYLVVEAEDLLRQPLVWDGLKRALRNERTTIEDPVDLLGLSAVRGLRPEPIPLDVKVVLVGEASIFYLLYSLDPDFRELFRVRADFDLTMPRTTENELVFASFVDRVTHTEQLRPFDQAAIATIVGFSSRLAEDQDKLSLQFGELTNLVRAASYWAGRAGASTVSARHVQEALDQQIYRSNLYEEKIRELISRDILLVDVAGEAVGQVNGLAVQAFANYQFGRPSRITASVGVGREGVVDV
ncbi:MAG TPA: ATP-binding protein, partial [Chloroflexota bacterium]|nr:ATP-binding protein [Chloroflexota bacterium]